MGFLGLCGKRRMTIYNNLVEKIGKCPALHKCRLPYLCMYRFRDLECRPTDKPSEICEKYRMIPSETKY